MSDTRIQTARRDRPHRIRMEFGAVGGRQPGSSFGDYCTVDSWQPAINIYRLSGRIDVCMDLAGVDKAGIDVRVEPGRLSIRGRRNAPQPTPPQGTSPEEPMRIVSMEIGHGQFCRQIALPSGVLLERVESEYRDGLLWVRLPVQPSPQD